jgi:glutaminyl-tRNA synthetase
VVKDETTGEIKEIHCTYDPETRSGSSKSTRKVKGTLHWVSASHAVKAEVRLYDHLFTKEDPEEAGSDFRDNINPDSLETLTSCMMEPSLKNAEAGEIFQFLRKGYFNVDKDSCEDKLVFNRIVSLKDSWAKILKQQNK